MAFLLLLAPSAQASGPYVTIQDDGTVQQALDAIPSGGSTDPTLPLLALYASTGLPVPQVLSVWTTFPQDGEVYATYFFPQSNDVQGVGLEQYGLPKTSAHAPLEDALFHNDVLQIATRAARAGAPADGYAQYLFLLELSHKWCGNAALPASDAGGAQDLVGFPFHWSFWMNAGGSPCGGNAWVDNHDGTFSVAPASPSTVAFSTFDLYLMGLAAASEVTPFGVLENPVPPPGVTDGLWGGAYAGHSFPWFGTATFTAQASSQRTVSIADVVAANGARSPAYGTAKASLTVGFVLLASKSDTPDSIASAQAVFDPIASSFAPRFASATRGRGSLVVVTAPPDQDAGADASPPMDDGGPAPPESGGCNVGGEGPSPFLLLMLALGFCRRGLR